MLNTWIKKNQSKNVFEAEQKIPLKWHFWIQLFSVLVLCKGSYSTNVLILVNTYVTKNSIRTDPPTIDLGQRLKTAGQNQTYLSKLTHT